MPTLHIKVQPSASRRYIKRMADGSLKVYLCSPPEKNKANKELIEYLSSKLNVPKSSIKIVSGHTGRLKMLRIDDVDSDYLSNKLI